MKFDYVISNPPYGKIGNEITQGIVDNLEWELFPKVSWTKSQTVQSILKDYGYTSSEIQAVMDDLKNFKGMDNE